MPIYHWKGLAHGQSVEGDLDVDTKEMALRRLRERGVTVREIRDRDSGERTPIGPLPSVAGAASGPEPLADRLARGRTEGTHPVRGLLITAGLVAAAAAIGTLSPVVFVDCARDAGGDRPLSCTISERVLGVYPLRETTLSPVVSADAETRSWTETRNKGPVTVTSQCLVLKDGRGREARPAAWGDSAILGIDGPTMQERIRALVADPAPGEASMWQAALVPLILPAILLVFALPTLFLSVLGMFHTPTDWISAKAGAIAEATDRKRRRRR
jgi:hypothetical protein